MHNNDSGGTDFPSPKAFTSASSNLRNSAPQVGNGQLSTEDLRILIAEMVD